MGTSQWSAYARETPLRDTNTGAVFYGPRRPVELPPAADDTFHTFAEGDKLPLIANNAWGTPELWWLVCDLNDVVDPDDVPVGMVLRLPSRARVEMELLG